MVRAHGGQVGAQVGGWAGTMAGAGTTGIGGDCMGGERKAEPSSRLSAWRTLPIYPSWRSRGSTTSARSPPATFLRVTSPPCARMTVRAIDRPSPMPPVSLLRD
jgi:hypothetical protein